MCSDKPECEKRRTISQPRDASVIPMGRCELLDTGQLGSVFRRICGVPFWLLIWDGRIGRLRHNSGFVTSRQRYSSMAVPCNSRAVGPACERNSLRAPLALLCLLAAKAVPPPRNGFPWLKPFARKVTTYWTVLSASCRTVSSAAVSCEDGRHE